MSTLLELIDLSAGYGAADVIHGLNMKIEEGSITTLLLEWDWQHATRVIQSWQKLSLIHI